MAEITKAEKGAYHDEFLCFAKYFLRLVILCIIYKSRNQLRSETEFNVICSMIDANKTSTTTNDPRANAPIAPVTTPPTKSPPAILPVQSATDPQATLLALLSQVANSSANNSGNGNG